MATNKPKGAMQKMVESVFGKLPDDLPEPEHEQVFPMHVVVVKNSDQFGEWLLAVPQEDGPGFRGLLDHAGERVGVYALMNVRTVKVTETLE